MSDADPLSIDDPAPRAALGRRGLRKVAGLTPGAAALVAAGGKSSKASDGTGDFPSTPKYTLVFVNHATTNPLFRAAQYGIQDACASPNYTYQWTGQIRDASEKSAG